MTPALIFDPCGKIEGIGVVQSTEKKTEARNDNSLQISCTEEVNKLFMAREDETGKYGLLL